MYIQMLRHFILCFFIVVKIQSASINSRAKENVALNVDEFLEKYGYMQRISQEESGFNSAEARESAIRKFQKFNGMKVTGYLDKKTIVKMKKPRCGVPDIIPDSPDQPQQYKVHGHKWNQNVITWKPTTYTSQLPESTQRHAFETAFKKWSDVSPMKFEYTEGKPDIEILFAKGEHGDGTYNSFDGRGKVLAHAYYPTNGDTHFDDDEKWLRRSFGSDGTDLEVVAAHEFGHALGLGHSHNPDSLMAPYYKTYESEWELHNDDISGIQSLYGVPNVKPDTSTASSTATTTKGTTTMSLSTTTLRTSRGVNCSVTFDAVTLGLDGFGYGFNGLDVYKMGASGLEPGYPKKIQDVFPQSPNSPDLAFKIQRLNHIYIFKGNRMWRYTDNKLDFNFPKQIKNVPIGRHMNFAIVLKNNWSSEQIYIFGDSVFWEFNKYTEDFVPRYELQISTYWKGISENVDSGILWTDGYIYLFQGTMYTKIDPRTRSPVQGYPKNIAPAWLGGICGSEPK